MEALVASLDDIKFDIEKALEEQHGALPLPFPGMDSKLYFRVVVSSLPILSFNISDAFEVR